jgi:hypothetical protein
MFWIYGYGNHPLGFPKNSFPAPTYFDSFWANEASSEEKF